MRISDWSSDVCSSDLLKGTKPYFDFLGEFSGGTENAHYYANMGWNSVGSLIDLGDWSKARYNTFNVRGNVDLKVTERSEERRVGKGVVRTGRSRWSRSP